MVVKSLLSCLMLIALSACSEAELDHEMCFGDEEIAVVGLVASGDSGVLTATITALDPDPPAIGNNHIQVEVTDSSGNLVTDVDFTGTETWQRVHDHGTPVLPIFESDGNGRYDLRDLNTFHRGSWLFRLRMDSPTAGSDFIEFNFGIECE